MNGNMMLKKDSTALHHAINGQMEQSKTVKYIYFLNKYVYFNN